MSVGRSVWARADGADKENATWADKLWCGREATPFVHKQIGVEGRQKGVGANKMVWRADKLVWAPLIWCGGNKMV